MECDLDGCTAPVHETYCVKLEEAGQVIARFCCQNHKATFVRVRNRALEHIFKQGSD